MVIKNTLLGGTDFIPEPLYPTDLNATFNAVGTYFTSKGTGNIFKDLSAINVPIGTILPWLKSIANTPALPSGWQECNGTNSTPNLIGTTTANSRFLRGTTGTTGGTGGSDVHNHGFSYTNVCSATNIINAAASTTSTEYNLPKRYSVVWIIKVS